MEIMAWRLDKAVVRGEIDNRTKGLITGTIWLIGVDTPVELKLKGNCQRDIAGHLLTFENPNPQANSEQTDLNPDQHGAAGDMTASRKVRIFDIPAEEALRMIARGEKPPEHTSNGLYLEWFSDFNGRVVIESTRYSVTISEPAWLMTGQEEAEQLQSYSETITRWIDRITPASSDAEPPDPPAAPPAWTPEDNAPMDEFQWEKFLKQSDRRTDKLMKLYEKYDGLEVEERDQLIAREMGWPHTEEAVDSDSFKDTQKTDRELPESSDIPDPKPNPLTEGIDWILDENGTPAHPLYLRCFDLVSDFRTDCNATDLLDKKNKTPLNELIFSAHMINAKLAGALNSLWKDHPQENGFVVASLKRALKYFNETMKRLQTVRQSDRVSEERLSRFHNDLCTVREEILRLMDKYRNDSDNRF